MNNEPMARAVFEALDRFTIELPSWGFADTGTRFGKFHQPAAASTVEEKFHDAGFVNRLTGICPTVAVHVLWDFPPAGEVDPKQAGADVAKLAGEQGIGVGSINPNLFQESQYKLGSFCSPHAESRQAALDHTLYSVALGQASGSSSMVLWLADGTNYPGQDSIRRRKHALEEDLKTVHDAMAADWPGARLLVEYKPFEPAFYHTDIADWGMSWSYARHAGENARVLVDTGHHFQGVNIEHIVAFLMDEGMLGGFHFNDRKYADDDLTLGSIDPYAVFRIFDQIAQYEFDTDRRSRIDYMVDQSHNIKPKLEAMTQTVMEAQKQQAKAHCVDREALAQAQAKGDVTGAERILKAGYETDVTDLLVQWRTQRNLPADPLAELRRSGVIDELGTQREAAREARGEVQVASYA